MPWCIIKPNAGDDAIRWHQQGSDLKRGIGNKLDIALGLSNLAAAYLFKGDLATAERLLDERRQLQINKSGVHLRHPGLVEIYLQTGRYNQALSGYCNNNCQQHWLGIRWLLNMRCRSAGP